MITVNPILVGLRRSIREKLLKFDSKRRGELNEATPAFGAHLGVDVDGGQNTVVHGFEAHVEFHLNALWHPGETLAQLLGNDDRASPLTHLARLVHEVTNTLVILLHRSHYTGLRFSRNRATGAGTYGVTSPPSAAT